jgi:hypothetical protein
MTTSVQSSPLALKYENVMSGDPPWIHHDGDEYLAANPVEVPSLASLLKSCYGGTVRYNGTIILDNVNKGVFYWKEKGVEKVDVFSDTADPTNVDCLTLS